MGPIEIISEYWGPWLCWILPIIGALLMPLIAKLGNKVRDYAAVIFAFSSVVAAGSMLPTLFGGHAPGDIQLTTWINFMGKPLNVGVLVDPLSILIANVVAFISFLIIVYSVGYMHGDEHLTRYWFFFLFFIGNMLLLVLSDNLLQLLIGWEGVGMCSYGLIGYYYRDEKERWLGGPPPTKMYPPSHAGMKAFVVTGVGDVFLLGAIFIIFNYAGTLNFVELINSAPSWLGLMSMTPGLIGLVALLFLGGPIGKSAQFPLHEWLPEAMAGPTSVSALIHAATMVKAGVYLVARMSPVFYIGYWLEGLGEAQIFFIAIACIGAFTAFLAASQAMVALELKKVLAYSTVSQIGFMMLALGLAGLNEGVFVAGLTAGVFHLISHALFKAALFLCAGSVIHAVETIYMSNMGGLGKYMPITKILMLLATLSLAGIPPFSGFWSKDAVFVAGLVAGTPLAMVLYGVAAVTALMTLVYSARYIMMTFYGEKSKFVENLEHHGHHVHESPKVMWGPIAILVIVMVGVGLLGLIGQINPEMSPEIFIEQQMESTLHGLHVETELAHVENAVKITAYGTSGAIILLGGVIAWAFYIARKIDPWAFVSGSKTLKQIHTFLWNRWYINKIYYIIFVDGVIFTARMLYNGLEKVFFDNITPVVSNFFIRLGVKSFNSFESEIIDEGINEGVPNLATSIYHRVKKFQTGFLSYNIVYIIFTFLVLLVMFILMFGGLK
jgi:NADH-quinone oxidoreductase subunit L